MVINLITEECVINTVISSFRCPCTNTNYCT